MSNGRKGALAPPKATQSDYDHLAALRALYCAAVIGSTPPCLSPPGKPAVLALAHPLLLRGFVVDTGA